MHELSICRALLKHAEAVASEHRASAVKLIKLRIGPLSGVDPHLLKQAYPLANRGTLAENAKLIIQLAPIRVHCPDCQAETQATINRLICGQCGNADTQLISGNEMQLVSVELAWSDDPILYGAAEQAACPAKS